MAYYNKLPSKSMTRGDHLRKDAKEWVKDEGSEYRRGRKSDSSRPSASGSRRPAPKT